MSMFRDAVEIDDPDGNRFERVRALVDTGSDIQRSPPHRAYPISIPFSFSRFGAL